MGGAEMRKMMLALVLAAVASGGYAASQETRRADMAMKSDQATVERIISGWRMKPQEAARKMIAKYGQPDEASAMRLVWHNNGPWKMTELVNEEVPHNFPKPHPDFLKQTISYRVPPGKFDAEAIRELKHPEYMQGLLFEASRAGVGDADMELPTSQRASQ